MNKRMEWGSVLMLAGWTNWLPLKKYLNQHHWSSTWGIFFVLISMGYRVVTVPIDSSPLKLTYLLATPAPNLQWEHICCQGSMFLSPYVTLVCGLRFQLPRSYVYRVICSQSVFSTVLCFQVT